MQRGMKESIEYAFFHCLVVRPLCELIEGFIVCMLYGQFFALDTSTICSNMSFLANRSKHFVLLYLLAIMRMVLWTMKMKDVYVELSLSSHHMVAFIKHQLKVKIRVERKRLSSFA